MENDVKGGRMVSAPTQDIEPKCPHCGAGMRWYMRTDGRGVKAWYACVRCPVKSPKVYADYITEDVLDAARLLLNNGFLDSGVAITNGDKIRELGNAPDEILAQQLLEIDGIAEQIPFCKNLPKCKERAERCEPQLYGECLKCMVDWLGQPAEEDA